MAQKTDIWMPLYIGDYLAATSDLTAEESGAYLHLLMYQWKNGELPSDLERLRRIAKVEKDAWSNAWAVLMPFFSFAKGMPEQLNLERIREEWVAKKSLSVGKATHAASKRWEKHASSKENYASSIAQALPQPSPSSSSLTSQRTTTLTASEVQDDSDEQDERLEPEPETPLANPREPSRVSNEASRQRSGRLDTVGEKPGTVARPTSQRRLLEAPIEPFQTENGISPEMVARAVMSEASLSGRELMAILTDICRAELGKGKAVDDLRDELVVAWQDYELARPNLVIAVYAQKFYGEGVWKNRAGWKRKSEPVAVVEKPAPGLTLLERQAKRREEAAAEQSRKESEDDDAAE